MASLGGRASTFGVGAKTERRRGLHLEGAWLVRLGGAFTCGGGLNAE